MHTYHGQHPLILSSRSDEAKRNELFKRLREELGKKDKDDSKIDHITSDMAKLGIYGKRQAVSSIKKKENEKD